MEFFYSQNVFLDVGHMQMLSVKKLLLFLKLLMMVLIFQDSKQVEQLKNKNKHEEFKQDQDKPHPQIRAKKWSMQM